VGNLRLALLISGGGTTAQRIIQACRSGELQEIVPVCVIASGSDVDGIAKAHALRVPTKCLRPNILKDERKLAAALIELCGTFAVDIIGQYGWLPKTPIAVIRAYQNRMINQHPGPLDPGRPDFGGKGMYGLRVHAARLLFARTVHLDFWTEATAQRVDAEFDKGTVLRRRKVEIFPDDDPISLQERVLPVEHDVQIEALRDFAKGQVEELSRSEPLIPPNLYGELEQAKKTACLLFPSG